jgi:hypothetical protein
MTNQEQESFQDYIRNIEDELLEAVTADYIWLAAQYEEDGWDTRFHWRRAACRAECSRRRKMYLWRHAERAVSGPMPRVA